MRIIFLICAILFTFVVQSQYYEMFDDCDARTNPVWFSTCVDARMVQNGERCGVELSLFEAGECAEGSFRTASLLSTDTEWRCLLDVAAAEGGVVEYWLSSALPRLGTAEGLCLRADIDNRLLQVVHCSGSGERVVAQAEVPVIDGFLEWSVVADSADFSLTCCVDSAKVWSAEFGFAPRYQSVSSGIRLISRSNNVKPRCILWMASCGGAPDMDRVPMEGDFCFSEIMYDPEPVVGLPAAEWVEIYNRTSTELSLADCTIASSSTVGFCADAVVAPNGYCVLVSEDDLHLMAAAGIAAVPVRSMPKLVNGGDRLSLVNKVGQQVATIAYDPAWIADTDKRKGGWTVECRDTDYPMSDADSWGASVDPRGGTPGEQNSISAEMEDRLMPRIESIGLPVGNEVVVRFNKPVDLTGAAVVAYGGEVVDYYNIGAEYDKLSIILSQDIDSIQPIEIALSGLYCFSGYHLPDTAFSIAAPRDVGRMDLVINEIMPYVDSTQSKFVELYNNSDVWVDLSRLRLCNPDSASGEWKNVRHISDESIVVSPYQYVVLVYRRNRLRVDAGLSATAIYHQCGMPSMPSAGGKVVLVDDRFNVVDRLDYSARWHHAAVKDRHNVSLERMSPLAPSSDSTNWCSAASGAGYNTAGWPNSQAAGSSSESSTRRHFFIGQDYFTPNADGVDDQLVINYTMPEAGYTLTAKLYTRSGSYVATLVDNHLLGTAGQYRWDGCDSQSVEVEPGLYVIVFSATSPSGKSLTEKLVAAKL